MASWRKNQGISDRQVGHRRSSSYYGKPPLGNRFSTVPSWENKFCATVGQVPWRRFLEGKRYMESHSDVMKWDDSAVKHAFHDAKNRFWAEINGYPCDIPLPDPDMYIDEVDWDASFDPELYLDLDRELDATRIMMEKSEQESEIVDIPLNHVWEIIPTGWGDVDEEETKPQEPNFAAEGWGSSNPENNDTNSWEQNNSQRWIPQEQNKYQARNGWNINGGGYNGRREKNHGYQHCNNDYKMNRRRGGGRGGGRGGKRGNYSYATKVL
ncbi:unnamed protein product [Lathyrus sativus]|nr:unnamed protein product [Lathyrus sativus]